MKITLILSNVKRWILVGCLLIGPAIFLPVFGQSQSTTADSLPTQTWPAGTHLAGFPEGGRVATFHRGVLYLGGNHAYYYNISDPENPQHLRTFHQGGNGHRWWKMGDLFQREYQDPESGSSNYTNLSNIATATTPWTGTSGPPTSGAVSLSTYPHIYAGWSGYLEDVRNGWERLGAYTPAEWNNIKGGLSSGLDMRLGNLIFYMGVEGNPGGVSAVDVGDPANAHLRSTLQGGYRQYTTGTFIWRHYLILMIGNNSNEGGNNLVAVDFSDPDNLRREPLLSLPTGTISSGRYVAFQDNFAFIPSPHGPCPGSSASNNCVLKYNMQTRQLVHTMTVPPGSGSMHDFWPMPLGHLLVATGNETGTGNTQIWAHQSGLDTTPPSIGYHLPRPGDTHQPVTTVIGLVINETLDDTTINSNSIQVRPVGGSPIQIDIVSSNYGVINIAPRQNLQADTTYEVRVLNNGIRDVAGNGINAYSFQFSTGDGSSSSSSSSSSSNSSSSSTSSASSTISSSISSSSISSSSSSSAISSSAPSGEQLPTITGISTGQSGPATAHVPVSLSVSTQGGNGTLQYRWQFGDGQQTGWVNQSLHNHTWLSAGDYTVVVQVRDSQGHTASRSINLVVAEPGASTSVDAMDQQARLRSSPIVVDGASRRVWVVNPDSDSVSLINANNLTLARTIEVCHRPMSVSFDSARRAWVVCRDSDQIRVVNANGATVQSIALPRGSRPVSIAMSPGGDTAYIALYATGELQRFDTSSFANTGVLEIGPTPWAMAVSANGGRLWITRLISADDAGQVTAVDTGSFSQAGIIPLAIDDSSAENGLSARGIPNYVSAIAPSPGTGNSAWYTAKKDNILRGLARDGQPLGHDSTVRTLVGKLDLATDRERLPARVDIDDTSQPSAVALSPWGAHVLVTVQGNDQLVALSQHSGDEVARANVGMAPQGVAIDPVTQRIFVQNFMGRSVTVLEGENLMSEGGRTLALTRIVVTVPASEELLPPQVLQGKRIFYNASDPRMGLEGYTSCASCHLDGGHDGRVWDFTSRGEGLRSTISLRGRGGMGHGRVHWSGNFDEIQDFEHDIRDAFGGSGFLNHEHFTSGTRNQPLGDPKAGLSAPLDALAAYVSSLDSFDPSPYRTAAGNLTPDAEQGRVLFELLGCADCHAGPSFTNSWRGQLHDVGTLNPTSGTRLGQTLTGIDTPTLFSLWEKSHYLHDGSAASLLDVLTHTHAREHGDMDQLNTAEREWLIAYLLQIDEEELSRFPLPPGNLGVE